MVKCLRCGKETGEKSVFCPDCLEEMDRYPVKPGTLIHIPVRPEAEARKAVRRKKELTLEEQLVHSNHLVQALFITVLCLLSALVVSGILLVMSMSDTVDQPEETSPQKARNYTIIESVED